MAQVAASECREHHLSPVQSDQKTSTTFVDDAWLATELLMTVATIRSQRFRRRYKKPHWLTIDPVLIGSKPRYILSEAVDWLESQTAHQPSDVRGITSDREHEAAVP